MSQQLKEIEAKVVDHQSISESDALFLYRSADMDELKRLAGLVRARFHPPNEATYRIMRIINYTNVCVALCDYCAFYRLPKSPEGYVRTAEEIFDKIDDTLALGGDLVGFNGGFNPKLNIDWYAQLFSEIRSRYNGQLEFYALTIAELMYIAKLSKLSYYQAAIRLRQAGVRWITGGGAEILTNSFRQRHSPLKYSADEFIEAQREVINAGIYTTATMVIGFDESLEERLEHLRRVRALHEETSAIVSFLAWTYKPENTKFAGKEIGSEEYLRHLAISRIYLDSIRHIRASVLTQNENALRGLHFGADDFDIPLEDEVTEQAGAWINRDIQAVLAQARAEGFETVFRSAASRTSDQANTV